VKLFCGGDWEFNLSFEDMDLHQIIKSRIQRAINEGIEEILNLKCGNGGKNEKHFADEFIHGFLV
jgi:hypothetical protein